jgi:hypothetical protein
MRRERDLLKRRAETHGPEHRLKHYEDSSGTRREPEGDIDGEGLPGSYEKDEVDASGPLLSNLRRSRLFSPLRLKSSLILSVRSSTRCPKARGV